MLTNSKIALSLALVLGTASAALAAPKHHVQRVPAAAYGAYAQVPAVAPQGYGYKLEHGRVNKVLGETGAVLIQDRDWRAVNSRSQETIW